MDSAKPPMKSYLDTINDYVNALDDATKESLQQISFIKTYKKGDFLLKQNEVCSKSFWVQSGIARKYYLNDGKEVTTELYFEHDLAVSFESYTLLNPSKEYIEALTDVTVSIIPHQAFQKAKEEHPKLAQLDLMFVEYYAMWVEQRLFQFHTMSASERYLEILKKQPHIVQTIPLTIVASYLGISLETLSRIRAKI